MTSSLFCVNCGASNDGFSVLVTEAGIHCAGRCVSCGMEVQGLIPTGVDFLTATHC
jgi:hypothetical protein